MGPVAARAPPDPPRPVGPRLCGSAITQVPIHKTHGAQGPWLWPGPRLEPGIGLGLGLASHSSYGDRRIATLNPEVAAGFAPALGSTSIVTKYEVRKVRCGATYCTSTLTSKSGTLWTHSTQNSVQYVFWPVLY
jgi:hypothetical protein